jgi:hypothetical protein
MERLTIFLNSMIERRIMFQTISFFSSVLVHGTLLPESIILTIVISSITIFKVESNFNITFFIIILFRPRSYLWANAKGHRHLLVIAVLFALLLGTFNAVTTKLVFEALNVVFNPTSTDSQLAPWCVAVAMSGVFYFFLSYFTRLQSVLFGRYLAQAMRVKMFEEALNRPASWYDQSDAPAGWIYFHHLNTQFLSIRYVL